MVRSLQRPFGTLLTFVAWYLLWESIGEWMLTGLASSTPAQVSAIIQSLGVALFTLTFLFQVIMALARRPSQVKAVDFRLMDRIGRGGASARDAALALIGPDAGEPELSDMTLKIAKAWAARPQLDYAETCRHEAAHAVTVHHFGAIVLKSHVNRNGSGQVNWACPPSPMSASTEQWMRLCITIAGGVLDHSEGRHHTGPTLDTNQVLSDAVGLLATGEAPPGFNGALTLDNILAHARALVGQVLADRRDALNEIAELLEESGELDGYQINRILGLSPAGLSSESDGQP